MKNIKAFLRIIEQLNYIMTSKQKRNSVVVFVTMILGAVLELLGVSVIYPFLQLIMDEEAFRSKWYLGWIYNLFPNITFSQTIILFCLLIIIIYIVKNLAMLLFSYIQNKNSAQFQRELSTLMLESILKRPYEYFVNNGSESILQHVHGDPVAAYGVLMNLYSFVSNIFSVVLIGIFLLYTDWVMAVSALSLAFICFFVTVTAFKKRLKESGRMMIELSARLSKASHEAIFGIKESTVLDRRENFVGKFSDAAVRVERVSVINGFISACPPRIIEAVCIGGFIGIAGISISLGDNAIEFIPTLGTFAMGAFKILPSISSMSGQINGIVFNQTRLGNCYDKIKEAERFDEEQARIVVDANVIDDVCLYSFNDKVEIKNVSWKYSGANNSVLESLSMEIKKGEAIALIGISGAGKTTLGDILLGLLKPQEGSIAMDGIDIKTIPNSWSRIVGYVPQTVFLTDDTIRSNVAFGLKDDEIDEKRVLEALDEAHMTEYIKSLPKGIETRVGERGVKFSGGQRQRIAIARALYANPDILILDEATSALDMETETAVMESIEKLIGQKTLVIIAHRLTTIRNCDRVFEITDGKAVERDKRQVFDEELIK